MTQHDLIVLGGGPGGYIAAIRAAQLGLDTACVDDNPVFGGTCLRVGCIPSKALLESTHRYQEASHGLEAHGVTAGKVSFDLDAMMARKDKIVTMLTRGIGGLFKKNGVTPYEGRGRLTSPGTIEVTGPDGTKTELTAKQVIVATGTRPAPLSGVELDGDRIGTSTEALAWTKPPKHLVVIGAGFIGLELGSVWARLGSKVTVLEYLDRVLPGCDGELANTMKRLLEKQGLEFHLGARVTGARTKGKTQCVVEYQDKGEGTDSHSIVCDHVLLSVGRIPVTQGLGLEECGVKLTERGYIEVGADFQTSCPGVYAIGDVIGGPQLAHKAEEEGVACVERMVTGYGHVNYDAIPGVVYTEPELASVGKTEEDLKESGVAYRKGSFPYRANGRARALEALDGTVKMLVDEETDRILGVHILGARAGDLIAEAVAAINFGATAEDLYRTSHAHPTLAEGLKEAALATAGRTLNL